MELTVKDRLYLPAILPEETNFSEYNFKKSVLNKTRIDDKEAKAIGLRKDSDSDRILWDTAKESEVVAEFSADELSFLKKSCEAISEKTLQDDMWELVEKIYNAASQK